MAKRILQILFYINILIYGYAVFLYFTHHTLYNKITGIGVLWMVFILLPYFLWYRYKDKKIEDFQFKNNNRKL